MREGRERVRGSDRKRGGERETQRERERERERERGWRTTDKEDEFTCPCA